MTISNIKGKGQNVQQFMGTESFLHEHSSTWLYCLKFTSLSVRDVLPCSSVKGLSFIATNRSHRDYFPLGSTAHLHPDSGGQITGHNYAKHFS